MRSLDPINIDDLTLHPGPNEKRFIVRQDLGHYRTLAIGAVYASSVVTNADLQRKGKQLFVPALRHCIDQHPVLSTVIIGADGEAPEYATPDVLDLSTHVDVLEPQTSLSEPEHIAQVVNKVCDGTFSNIDTTPPWKIVVASLSGAGSSTLRLLILLAYYHSHGDGRSALAFHTSFLEGLESSSSSADDASHIYQAPTSELLPPIEKAGKLYVSWSYLLGPLLSVYLPTFISRALGFRPPAAEQQGRVWTGKPHTYDDPTDFTTSVEMMQIDHDCMKAVLRKCKANGTTFTGLLNHLIARALSELPDADAFASQIVVDLRKHLPAIGPDDMASAVTAYYETIPRTRVTTRMDSSSDATAKLWEAARKTGEGLVKTASTLRDQPVGLLQYLSKFRPWTEGQIGNAREASFEISNLVVFDPRAGKEDSVGQNRWGIEKAIFAQPANAAGAAISFSIVTAKNGPLVMTASWQRGVLDLADFGSDLDESTFVAKVCGNVAASLRQLAND